MQNFQHMKEIHLLSDTIPTHLEILLSRFLWKHRAGVLKRTIPSAKGSKLSIAYTVLSLGPPYCIFRLADYAAVSFGNSVFIYGGNDGKAEMRTVAEYRNGEWNKVGDMLYKREGHNAILNGNIALIMGGFGSL